MSDTVDESFYIADDSSVHRVASISYSENGESVQCFCSSSYEIEDKNELTSVPLRLLNKDEVCVECERNYSHIQKDRFNLDQNDADYKFFVKATIKVGEKKGYIIQETVESNSIKEAKELIEDSYKKADIHKYHYISRSPEYGDWDVLVDTREDFDT